MDQIQFLPDNIGFSFKMYMKGKKIIVSRKIFYFSHKSLHRNFDHGL